MIKPKAHFDQVPLVIAQKIAMDELQEKRATSATNAPKGEQTMTHPVDIFQTEAEGNVLWLGSAATIEDARARIRALDLNSPAQFLLLDQKSGHKLFLKLE